MLHWISSTYSKRLLIWKDEQETGGDPGGPTRKQNETVAGDWKRPVKALVGCYRPLAQPEGHWLGGMRLNNKQLMIELAMPVAFMLMAAYVIVKALSMGSEGVFPIMCAGVLLICAVYLLVQTLMKREVVVKLEGVNLPRVGLTLLTLLVYVFLLKKIGYAIDTFLLCALVIRSLGYKKFHVIVPCSVIEVAVKCVIFKVLLSVPLPMVFLDF